MARTKTTTKTEPSEGIRRCTGSVKFGIEAHDAPVADFPVQPSQKDGLGRMCKPHWREYTASLRRASTPPKEAPASVAEVERAKADKLEAKAARLRATVASVDAKAADRAAAALRRQQARTAKPSRKALQATASAEHNATVRAEATASTPDFEAAAEQDAILVERKQRVKAWRKSEVEGTAA